MNEAIQYFLKQSLGDLATNSPDEGIDYIFMLENEDWQLLEKEWENRSCSWKEGLTYFAGFAELSINKQILLKAISSNNNELIEQGLLSFHECIKQEIESENPINDKITDRERILIINKILKYKEDFDSYPEFQELLQPLEA